MNAWKECKLGEVTSYSQAIQVPMDEQKLDPFEDSIRFIRIVDFSKDKNSDIRYIKNPGKRYIVNHNDLVMIRYGSQTAGRITKGFYGSIANNTFKIEVDDSQLDKNFLFHYFSQKEVFEYFHSSQLPSTMPAITFDILSKLSVVLPSLPEQKAIAGVLSSLDDKIDLLHRQNKTLESMAETLFRQWFIEEADESWEEGKLPDEFDFVMGASPPGESYNESGDGMPMYQGNADFEYRFPKRRIFTTDPKRFAEKYDTLISVRALVGAQNMADEKCCIVRGVAAFRYRRNSAYYSYTYFKMKSLMKEIERFNHTRTVFGPISKTDIEELTIGLPTDEVVDSYQKEVKPIDDKIIANCFQICMLEKLRDTLLPKLMSGEVRVNA